MGFGWFPSSGLGTLILQAPDWSFFGKLELQKLHSQAGVLIVIHKCLRPVISARMPKSSVQGWQTVGHNRCPYIHGR